MDTSTADMLTYAGDYREDPAIFEQIMLELNERDCTPFVAQISALREHWLQLIRREGARRAIKAQSPEWPKRAVVGRAQALSDEVFAHAEGMLSFMGYSVGATSAVTTMERRQILTYVYTGQLPFVMSRAYTLEWGPPGSYKRLSKLKNTLLSFIRNAQRRRSNMAIAIQEWQEDLKYIHQAFG
jgi:hypothetical protein